MSVGRKAIVSTLWTSGANYIAMGVGLVFGILRDRILLPYDNGIYAFGMATVDILFILSAVSFNITIIQADEETEDLYSTAFVLTIILSILMVVAVLLVSYLLYVRETVIIKIEAFLVLAAFSILNLFSMLFTSYLEKQLEYKRIARINVIAILAFPVTSLLLVSLGWGAWGMVLGQGASFLVSFFGMLIVSRYPIGFRFNPRTARWFVSMGWKLVISRGLEVVFVQYGTFITEYLLGTAQQGSYSRILKYWQMAPQTVAPAVVTVALPTYAKLQKNEEKLHQAFSLVVFFLVRILMPFALVFAVIPTTFIRIIGTQWLDGVPVLQILAIAAILAPLFENMKQLLYSQGRPERLISIRIIQLILFLPAMYFLVRSEGISGAAYAITLNYLVGVVGLALMVRGIFTSSLLFRIMIPFLSGILSACVFILIPMPALSGGPLLQFLFEASLLLMLFLIFEAMFEWRDLKTVAVYVRKMMAGESDMDISLFKK